MRKRFQSWFAAGRRFVAPLVVCAAAAPLPAPVAAQVPVQQGTAGRAASNAADTAALRAAAASTGMPAASSVLDGLRRSGMTRAQVRTGLELLGYDPGLADPYFAALGGRAAPPEPTPRVLAALGGLGVPGIAPLDSLPADTPWVAAATLPALDSTAGPRLFG